MRRFVNMPSIDEKKLRGLVEAFRQLPTGNIADAMDELGLANGVATGLYPIDRKQPPLSGLAITVQQGPRRPGAGAERLTRHPKVLDETAKPGDVMVISVGGRVDACTWGGILSLRAKKKGLAGLVIDGAARDINEMAETGLPTFIKGATPRASHLVLETLAINQPINCAGVHVCPGDIVVGDDTGVVFVPQAYAERILRAAQAIKEREEHVIAELRR
jgi:regulator of RNase E activity RraA